MAPFAVLMLEDFDAAETADATVVLIVAKSQLYVGLYLLALVTFALLWLLPPWWRWIAGFCVAMVLIAALSMARALHILHRANRFYRRGDRVLLHHRLMNARPPLSCFRMHWRASGWDCQPHLSRYLPPPS